MIRTVFKGSSNLGGLDYCKSREGGNAVNESIVSMYIWVGNKERIIFYLCVYMSCFGVFSIHNFQVLRRPNEEDTAELPFGK